MRARGMVAWLKRHFADEIRAIHELKSWPDEFQPVLEGTKRHEVRVMDRDFQVGDLLYLREFNPATGRYTGRRLFRQITHITTPGEFGLPDYLGVLSVR